MRLFWFISKTFLKKSFVLIKAVAKKLSHSNLPNQTHPVEVAITVPATMRRIALMIIPTHWMHAKTIPTRSAVGFGALAPTTRHIEATIPIPPA